MYARIIILCWYVTALYGTPLYVQYDDYVADQSINVCVANYKEASPNRLKIYPWKHHVYVKITLGNKLFEVQFYTTHNHAFKIFHFCVTLQCRSVL